MGTKTRVGRRRPPDALPPDMVVFVPQNGDDHDCAVSVVAMLFGLKRDEALLLCGLAAPRVLERGMFDADIDRAIRAIGVKGRWLRPADVDFHDATGLLIMEHQKGGHAALLWAGRIIDGNGELWLDPDDYLAHYKYKPSALLVRA
jgi:hypothetical protein